MQISEEIGKPEIIRVQCDVHAGTQGWLFVTDHPATVTDATGAFKLENVPPGRHKVHVFIQSWAPNRR